jgi:hypothetical protein
MRQDMRLWKHIYIKKDIQNDMREEIRSENDDIIWGEDIQIKLSFGIIYHEISQNTSFFQNLHTILRTCVQNIWWKVYWCVGGAWNMSKGWGSWMGAAKYVQRVAKYFGDIWSHAKIFRDELQSLEVFVCFRSAFAEVWTVAMSVWSVMWCVLRAWASRWTYQRVHQWVSIDRFTGGSRHHVLGVSRVTSGWAR